MKFSAREKLGKIFREEIKIRWKDEGGKEISPRNSPQTKMRLLRVPILSQVLRNSTRCSIRYLSATSPEDHHKEHYDVIIAGGGLVGVSLAVSLGKFCLFTFLLQVATTKMFLFATWISAKNETLADKKVLLLESAPPFKEPSKEKYSNRVSAINKQSVGLLKKLDAWPHIESIRCKPVMQMQARLSDHVGHKMI